MAAHSQAQHTSPTADYQPRHPEKTALYRIIQQHHHTFQQQIEEETSHTLPKFITQEFDAYLQCGILAHGFLRLACEECRHETLIAFSCKGRGFCPSCGARRMVETAQHLISAVIPHVPVRQWVLSLPILLRYLLAAQPQLLNPLLEIIHRAINSHLLKKAGLKTTEGQSGGVTFIQRFGFALNLNMPQGTFS